MDGESIIACHATAAMYARTIAGICSRRSLVRPPKSTLHGRYVIERTLGGAGREPVYVASVPALEGRLVAILEVGMRSIPPARRKRTLEQIEEETRRTASLCHPALGQVMDFFAEGDSHFIVAAYTEGEALDALQARQGEPFPVSTVLEWADQICDILEYLHGQVPPMLLRNLKHATIVLDGRGRIAVTHFGIARTADTRASSCALLTRAGLSGHAAIELCGNNFSTDPRSDIHGLGAMILALLSAMPSPASSGLPPGGAKVQRPCALNPELSPDLEVVILKMTAAMPQARYQAVTQARQALRSVRAAAAESPASRADGRGTVAHRPPASEPMPAALVLEGGHLGIVGPGAEACEVLAHPAIQPEIGHAAMPSPRVSAAPVSRQHARVVAVLFVDFPTYPTLRTDQQLEVRTALNAAMRQARTLAAEPSSEYFVDVQAGDSAVVVFTSNLAGPLELAMELQQLACDAPLSTLAMRMGLHVGTVIMEGTVPVGAAINMAQRVAASGSFGQVTASGPYLEMLHTVSGRYEAMFGKTRDIVVKHGKVLTVAPVRIGPGDRDPSTCPSTFHLEMVSGAGNAVVVSHPIGSRPVVIGRAGACDIRIDDAGVSRRHVTIEDRNGRLYLRHESATNPTLVNGRVVEGESPLQPGDEIELSIRTKLRVRRDVP